MKQLAVYLKHKPVQISQ